MTGLYNRILKIAKNEGFNSIHDFAINGLKYKSSEKLNRLKNQNSKPSYDVIRDLAKNFPQYSLNWVVTGEIPDNQTHGLSFYLDILESEYNIKYPDQSVQENLLIAQKKNSSIISLPVKIKCDGALINKDNFLDPVIKFNDILLYKKDKDFLSEVNYGKPYIVTVNVNNEQVNLVRKIGRSNDPDYDLTLHGVNDSYNFSIRYKQLKAVKKIVAVVSYNTHEIAE